MSLTESNIARVLAKESTSVTETTGTVGSIIAIALIGGTLAAAPVVYNKHEIYNIIEVPSVKSHTVKITTWKDAENYFRPRTSLGKRLLEIRNEAISKGLSLLDAEEITSELSRRRGELVSA